MTIEVEIAPLRPGALRELEPEWRALERDPDSGRFPFRMHDWLCAWTEVYRPERLMLVRMTGADGEVTALGLLQARPGGRLRFAGEPVTPYRGLVCARGAQAAAWRALSAWLAANPGSWRSLEGEGLPAEASWLPGARVTYEPIFGVDLPGTFDNYLAARRPSTRKRLRQRLRLLARAGGQVVEVPPHERAQALADFLRLHAERARSKGERHPGVDGRMTAMLEHLDQAEEMRLRLLALKVDGVLAGVTVRIDSADTAYFYNAGIDSDHLQLSPGVVLELESIRDAIGRGLTRFDLGPGDYAYKRHLGGVPVDAFRVEAVSSAPSGRLQAIAGDSLAGARARMAARRARASDGGPERDASEADRSPHRGGRAGDVEVVETGVRALEADAAVWSELERTAAGASPYLTHGWLSAWARVYRPGDLRFVRVREGGRLIALGLVEASPGRRWRFGGAPVTPERGLLCADGCAAAAWELFGRWLEERPNGWATLEAEGLRSRPAWAPRSWLAAVPAPAMGLPASFEAYLASRPPRTRKRLKERLRLLHREGGRVHEVPDDEQARRASLEQFVRLHAKRAELKGERHRQVDDRLARLLESLPAARGTDLRLFELTVGGGTLGVGVRLDRNGTAYSYNDGIDTAATRLSPGMVLELESLRHAIDHGLTRYDLGPGAYPYKETLGARAEDVFNLQATSSSVSGQVVGLGEAAYREARRRVQARRLAPRAPDPDESP